MNNVFTFCIFCFTQSFCVEPLIFDVTSKCPNQTQSLDDFNTIEFVALIHNSWLVGWFSYQFISHCHQDIGIKVTREGWTNDDEVDAKGDDDDGYDEGSDDELTLPQGWNNILTDAMHDGFNPSLTSNQSDAIIHLETLTTHSKPLPPS